MLILFSVGRYLSHQLWHNAVSHTSSPERAMAKNKIQFQEGLSLPRFLATYGTEEQCRQVLFKMRWPQGLRCPKCGHKYCYALQSHKLYQCRHCRFQASLTQGTIFASTKLPLPTWMLAIYLVTQSKDGISSLNLARIIGVSAKAALRLKHKLQQVMKNRDDQLVLRGLLLIDDAYWGGKRRDGKRGRAAPPARTPLSQPCLSLAMGTPCT